jgi:hypothetical protein
LIVSLYAAAVHLEYGATINEGNDVHVAVLSGVLYSFIVDCQWLVETAALTEDMLAPA